MATDWIDSVLQTASDTTSAVIDAWGRVQVANLDAQIQPPPQTVGDIQLVMDNARQSPAIWIAGAILLAAIGYAVLKK